MKTPKRLAGLLEGVRPLYARILLISTRSDSSSFLGERRLVPVGLHWRTERGSPNFDNSPSKS